MAYMKRLEELLAKKNEDSSEGSADSSSQMTVAPISELLCCLELAWSAHSETKLKSCAECLLIIGG